MERPYRGSGFMCHLGPSPSLSHADRNDATWVVRRAGPTIGATIFHLPARSNGDVRRPLDAADDPREV